jgi:hypothetical protein
MELAHSLTLSPDIQVAEGAVLAGRVLNDKSTYDHLEDVHGRMTSLKRGDIVVGALGKRQALHGYAGEIPEALAVGDTIQILNLGGVLGQCSSQNPEVGPPFDIEVLGQVLEFPGFQSRRGVPANIAAHAAGRDGALPTCPIVVVCGACMNSGKTVAASCIVSQLSRQGYAVGGAKLTGVSLLRDTLLLRDYGAHWTYDFTDAGLPSTGPANALDAARCILGLLAAERPDVIVLEMGDGIFGQYGVQQILADPAVKALISVLVYCANDPAGVYGGVRALSEQYGLHVDLVSGPVTDNAVGKQYVRGSLGVSAVNARLEPGTLGAELAGLLEADTSLRGARHAG